jgi:integrase
MGINKKEFIHRIDIGLKADKAHSRFFYRCIVEGREYTKLFNYTSKAWDKRTRVSQARTDAKNFRDKKINPISDIDENIKFDEFIKEYFKYLPNTSWKQTKINHYNNYIASHLAKKKVQSIKQMHIKECIKIQEDLGLKPRTIKTTLEVLNPVFKDAIANRLIDFNPCTGIAIKIPKTKKIVVGASEQLLEIFNAIQKVFKDDPFYQSLYFFALQGRRKSEIFNLKWENIDFNKSTFLIEDTKNGEHQMFALPDYISELLQGLYSPKGYVYESRINKGSPIVNIEKQTRKIKNIIPKFTLHYMRNVVVSAMAEQGVSATLMSGALGHNNTNTLSKYLSLNYGKGSEEANRVIDEITNVH